MASIRRSALAVTAALPLAAREPRRMRPAEGARLPRGTGEHRGSYGRASAQLGELRLPLTHERKPRLQPCRRGFGVVASVHRQKPVARGRARRVRRGAAAAARPAGAPAVALGEAEVMELMPRAARHATIDQPGSAVVLLRAAAVHEEPTGSTVQSADRRLR